MARPQSLSTASLLGSAVLIAVVVGGAAAAFAYTAGWLTTQRLTPTRLVAALAPPSGPALGHRRNHAKGICFTGMFDATGAGTALSTAPVFGRGEYPAVGRFNLGTADADAPDSTVRVRGMGLQIETPDGAQWRAAMINAPVFPVSTPQEFYTLLMALKSHEPDAMKEFVAANPEFAAFGAWNGLDTWTGSYAEERYNSLDSFVFTDASGAQHTVRWSLLPVAAPVTITPAALARLGPGYLEHEIVERVSHGPVRFTMMVTVADPADPTADPSKPWPADRHTINVGALVVQRIEAERNGPCRDVNFDPTVLPSGMQTSDDPFPAARSAAYMKSYDLRTAEAKDYPRTAPGAQP